MPFYVLHIFRMTVFFVLAGFFARMLLERRGVGGFIANRPSASPLRSRRSGRRVRVDRRGSDLVAVRANGGVMPEGDRRHRR